ncbi:hypothetical protein [Herbaspirillum rubrisubalbicans]|uniref:Uncharacterized protein n=1 Tax=Herbaspirillum rubrisubalbicans Os34 TaxID=1235827 RepID=A0A6M3ZRJ9_9BURK|nr:hypothetical protein [Herbaspirillum rubrisubalbicans]QJQ00991.1 hypothetical protein C798_12325 [Herbaspirillum rubrisubalbicans Os34]
MIELSPEQYQQFLESDTQHFIAAAADQYLAAHEEMRSDPGRAEVLERMRTAFERGRAIGFTSTPHLLYMMTLEAGAPGLFGDELIRYYLSKPGATPEQRLDDFDAIFTNELQRMKEKK